MSDAEFSESEVADPYVGTVVQGKYRFVRKLGEGGMGAVYEGENITIRRKVAIKCLHQQLARNANVVARFRNEALAATQIGNEHIVDVLDMGQMPDGSFFLVLEFLDGTDLAGLLEKERVLSVGRAVKITQQVLAALGAAHRAGIIHRDIKPENVFLVKRSANSEFVKLLDFGIAKVTTEEPSVRTATGSQLGTPYYMPPEQAMGHKDIDARADLYATAVMLFHALSDRFPFEGDSLPMLMYNICHTEALQLAALCPNLPGELCAVITGALSKNRDEHPRTAEEFAQQLEPFASLALVPAGAHERPSVEAPKPMATPSKSNKQGSNTTLGASASAVDLRPTPARSSNKLSILLGGVAVASLAIAGTTVAITRNSTPPAVDGARRATEPATLAAQEPNAARTAQRQDNNVAAPSTPSAQRVQVQISTIPEAALIILDGRPLNNPYDGDLPVTDTVHQLAVSAPGYRTELRTIMRTDSQRIRITLERGSGSVVVQSNGQRVRGNATTAAPSANPTPQQTTPPSGRDTTANTQPANTQPANTQPANTVTPENELRSQGAI
jgi:serine/threonine-protein kinase